MTINIAKEKINNFIHTYIHITSNTSNNVKQRQTMSKKTTSNATLQLHFIH